MTNEQTAETAETVTWRRRHMRRPGSSVHLNDFIAKSWHILSPGLGSSGTYCGVNVNRFAGESLVAPLSPPPEGEVCAKCIRQHELGRVRPQGRGRRLSFPPATTGGENDA